MTQKELEQIRNLRSFSVYSGFYPKTEADVRDLKEELIKVLKESYSVQEVEVEEDANCIIRHYNVFNLDVNGMYYSYQGAYVFVRNEDGKWVTGNRHEEEILYEDKDASKAIMQDSIYDRLQIDADFIDTYLLVEDEN